MTTHLPTTLADAVAPAERVALEAARAHTGGNLSKAARILEIDRNTLKRKISKLDISYPRLPSGRPADAW